MNCFVGGRRGRDRMILDLQLPMQSVPITTNVVSSNPTQAKQHYVINIFFCIIRKKSR